MLTATSHPKRIVSICITVVCSVFLFSVFWPPMRHQSLNLFSVRPKLTVFPSWLALMSWRFILVNLSPFFFVFFLIIRIESKSACNFPRTWWYTICYHLPTRKFGSNNNDVYRHNSSKYAKFSTSQTHFPIRKIRIRCNVLKNQSTFRTYKVYDNVTYELNWAHIANFGNGIMCHFCDNNRRLPSHWQ